jgi:hypothetical protein
MLGCKTLEEKPLSCLHLSNKIYEKPNNLAKFLKQNQDISCGDAS